MNSIQIIRSGRETYYIKLGKEDYYTKDSAASGVFLGDGAKELGIYRQEIKYQDKTLQELFHGSHNGQQLRKGLNCTKTYYSLKDDRHEVKLCSWQAKEIKELAPEKWSQKTTNVVAKFGGKENARDYIHERHHKSVVAYDNVLSAPKDVSVVWGLTQDQSLKNAIEKAHTRATEKAVQYLEQQAEVRTGKNGVDRASAKCVFACFEHQVSRDLDMQLHTHVLQLNFGIHEGGTHALDGKKYSSSDIRPG